jgi:tyrocidine synthetase-2
VAQGKLILDFRYNQAEYREATIDKIAESFRNHLITIINHCTAQVHTEMTPSDISKEALTIEDIENIYDSLKDIAVSNEDV